MNLMRYYGPHSGISVYTIPSPPPSTISDFDSPNLYPKSSAFLLNKNSNYNTNNNSQPKSNNNTDTTNSFRSILRGRNFQSNKTNNYENNRQQQHNINNIDYGGSRLHSPHQFPSTSNYLNEIQTPEFEIGRSNDDAKNNESFNKRQHNVQFDNENLYTINPRNYPMNVPENTKQKHQTNLHSKTPDVIISPILLSTENINNNVGNSMVPGTVYNNKTNNNNKTDESLKLSPGDTNSSYISMETNKPNLIDKTNEMSSNIKNLSYGNLNKTEVKTNPEIQNRNDHSNVRYNHKISDNSINVGYDDDYLIKSNVIEVSDNSKHFSYVNDDKNRAGTLDKEKLGNYQDEKDEDEEKVVGSMKYEAEVQKYNDKFDNIVGDVGIIPASSTDDRLVNSFSEKVLPNPVPTKIMLETDDNVNKIKEQFHLNLDQNNENKVDKQPRSQETIPPIHLESIHQVWEKPVDDKEVIQLNDEPNHFDYEENTQPIYYNEPNPPQVYNEQSSYETNESREAVLEQMFNGIVSIGKSPSPVINNPEITEQIEKIEDVYYGEKINTPNIVQQQDEIYPTEYENTPILNEMNNPEYTNYNENDQTQYESNQVYAEHQLPTQDNYITENTDIPFAQKYEQQNYDPQQYAEEYQPDMQYYPNEPTPGTNVENYQQQNQYDPNVNQGYPEQETDQQYYDDQAYVNPQQQHPVEYNQPLDGQGNYEGYNYTDQPNPNEIIPNYEENQYVNPDQYYNNEQTIHQNVNPEEYYSNEQPGQNYYSEETNQNAMYEDQTDQQNYEAGINQRTEELVISPLELSDSNIVNENQIESQLESEVQQNYNNDGDTTSATTYSDEAVIVPPSIQEVATASNEPIVVTQAQPPIEPKKKRVNFLDTDSDQSSAQSHKPKSQPQSDSDFEFSVK